MEGGGAFSRAGGARAAVSGVRAPWGALSTNGAAVFTKESRASFLGLWRLGFTVGGQFQTEGRRLLSRHLQSLWKVGVWDEVRAGVVRPGPSLLSCIFSSGLKRLPNPGVGGQGDWDLWTERRVPGPQANVG